MQTDVQIDQSKPVLVTGANGYVASWLVKDLLEKGLTVHATVRNPDDENKVGHLKALAAAASGELKLFKADLLEEGVFDTPMQGCELVFHTASPFVMWNITDPQAQLIEPAKRGTLNVLESVDRTASVKRVVLTTSVAAIFGDNCDCAKAPNGVLTEANWNSSSSESHNPYSYSKTVAEQVAWEAVEQQKRWDLVCINPGLVFGPSLTQASQSTSLSTIKELVDGTQKMGVPHLEIGIVDVRDVAKAHMQAGFLPSASGRHICVSETKSLLGLAQAIRAKYGNKYPLPRMQVPKALVWAIGPIMQPITRDYIARNVGHKLRFDNSYTREDLQMEFRPVAETICDHMEQLLQDGIIKRR